MPSCQPELSNINQRATDNNLRLNPDKPLEIIFYARGRRGIQAEAQPPAPPTIRNIERANSINALGVIISSQLSMTEHASTILDSCARSISGLRLLRARGMNDNCLQEVFHSMVLARLVYASPSWSGFCSASDVNNSVDFSTGANLSNTTVRLLPASLNSRES